MTSRQLSQHGSGLWQTLLQWFNLRPEESERTFLMFAFYTSTSIGLIWLEACAVALFLNAYGADSLPLIYVAGALIGSSLGFFYSWLQKVLPLRWVIVTIASLLAIPLLFFRVGLAISTLAAFTVSAMRLWLEAFYVLNDLNTSITANQLFNIREIKRTYPIISSGLLLADVVSGFSLPFLLSWIGLRNVIMAAFTAMIIGVVILFYLSQNYQQAFPESPRRQFDLDQADAATRRIRGPVQRYVVLLLIFFVLSQMLYLLADFQFLYQIEVRYSGNKEQIAGFLGLFSGILGLCELTAQWFLSSRAIERLGIFAAVSLMPISLLVMGTLSFLQTFWGLIFLKFLDELLRYTILASVGPNLFQPLPEIASARIQSWIRGIAEPLAVGATGLGILATLSITNRFFPNWRTGIFIIAIVIFAGIWLIVLRFFQGRYLELLVLSAERGQLSASDVDLRAYKQAIAGALERPSPEAEKLSCIQLLVQFDPENAGDILSPLLPSMSPNLQRRSLEVMLEHPHEIHLEQVRSLISRSLPPEVLAVALRYVWLTDPNPEVQKLRPYLRPEVDPIVRGTAASLMLRRGTPQQKAEATNALRQMLTHQRERERVMGCRALGEADYMQALRLYIPNLLQDESLRVRCALIEAIGATRLTEYYPSLLRALHYKSTREAAIKALVKLENESIPMLVNLGSDPQKPEQVQLAAWTVIGQIGSLEALNALVTQLEIAWGNRRRGILRILVKLPQETGIYAVLDRMGRRGVESLIDQELHFMGHLYAVLIDLSPERVSGRAADLLRRALQNMLEEAVDRLFLLLRMLCPLSAIQAASFNLQSGSRSNMARGLEILDSTLDIQSKRTLLILLDRRSNLEKLQSLADVIKYEPMSPSDRLRYILDLRHFLSDWAFACCFHLAYQERWSLTPEQTLAALRSPTGFVREAVLTYLTLASSRSLREILPLMQNDPDRLVAAQVQQLMSELGVSPSRSHRSASLGQNFPSDLTGMAGFGTV